MLSLLDPMMHAIYLSITKQVESITVVVFDVSVNVTCVAFFCGIKNGVAPWLNLFDGVVSLHGMFLIELSSYFSWADNAGVLPLV